MTKMTKQDEFLVRLKDPVYGKVHGACLEIIDTFGDVIVDIDILKCPEEECVYDVVVYAVDTYTLEAFNLAVKSLLCEYVKDGFVQPDQLPKKVEDKLYSRNYYVFGNIVPNWTSP